MEKVSIFFGRLEYFTSIWYILWSFGNFVTIRYIFPDFGILCREKSGNPGCNCKVRSRLASALISENVYTHSKTAKMVWPNISLSI
jgi:hypothetical protein